MRVTKALLTVAAGLGFAPAVLGLICLVAVPEE